MKQNRAGKKLFGGKKDGSKILFWITRFYTIELMSCVRFNISIDALPT